MKRTFLFAFLLAAVSLSAQEQEKEQPPAGGAPKDFVLPDKEVVQLENGLQLVMIPYGAIPKANINIVVKTGNIHEKENEVWLSDLMADLLEEGSTTMNAKEIANKMAGMGGNLNIGAGPHNTSLSSSVLYEFVPEAITLMADVLKNPGWPASELDRLKNDMKRNLSVTLTRPRSQANRDFYAAIYPDHPYGRIYPTDEMIDSYTLEDIKNFYTANFGAQRTTIYVAGKFNADKVKKSVETVFGDWPKGPEHSFPVAEATVAPGVQLIDREGAPQSTIFFGLPVADPSSPDYVALDITNSLLGGSFGSRITSNIREDKGYTYSPTSILDNNYKSAVWYERADVTTQFTGPSLQEINKEISKLQNEAPAQEELEGIQNYEAGLFVLQNSTPGGIIGQLIFLDTHELDDSYLTNRVKNIYAVTPQQVQEMTKKYIRPEDMTLVIVGDKKIIEEQIKDYEETIKNY